MKSMTLIDVIDDNDGIDTDCTGAIIGERVEISDDIDDTVDNADTEDIDGKRGDVSCGDVILWLKTLFPGWVGGCANSIHLQISISTYLPISSSSSCSRNLALTFRYQALPSYLYITPAPNI